MDDNIIAPDISRAGARFRCFMPTTPWGEFVPGMVTMLLRGHAAVVSTRAANVSLAMDNGSTGSERGGWRRIVPPASKCLHQQHAGVDTTYLDVRRRQLRRQ